MFYNDLSPIPDTQNQKANSRIASSDASPSLGEVTRGVAERRERRQRSSPVPVNLSKYLNDEQHLSLRQMESFGWQLAFVRRPLFQEPVVVVTNERQTQYGVLEVDGSINTHAMIELRH